jgi:hypothetical protein
LKEKLIKIGAKIVTTVTAKTLRKADEPRAERVTKQERVLTLLSQSEGASIEEMRARVSGGHGEKEARFFTDIIQVQRRRSPLPHRNASTQASPP